MSGEHDQILTEWERAELWREKANALAVRLAAVETASALEHKLRLGVEREADTLNEELAAVRAELDQHIEIELVLSDELNARDAELAALLAERDEARQALSDLSDKLLSHAGSLDPDSFVSELLDDIAAALPVAARPETDAR